MLTDQQGNSLSGATAEAVELFDQAVKAFNIYRGDPIHLLDQATEAAPDFAMAHITKAHLLGLATEPKATAEAKAIIANVKTSRLSEREASHVAALDLLLEGQWTAAAVTLARHSAYFPHDIVAVQSGHLMDFCRANARDLRDRIARVLAKWSPNMPGYSILLGMYASGWKSVTATLVPRRRGAGLSRCSRSIAGRTMRWPMSWRCRAGLRMASGG